MLFPIILLGMIGIQLLCVAKIVNVRLLMKQRYYYFFKM